jgi:hypothetical protein
LMTSRFKKGDSLCRRETSQRARDPINNNDHSGSIMINNGVNNDQ